MNTSVVEMMQAWKSLGRTKEDCKDSEEYAIAFISFCLGWNAYPKYIRDEQEGSEC